MIIGVCLYLAVGAFLAGAVDKYQAQDILAFMLFWPFFIIAALGTTISFLIKKKT